MSSLKTAVSSGVSVHAELLLSLCMPLFVLALDEEERDERATARCTSGRYESSPCSMERHVGVDRARDLDLRGPGDAPPDYRRARRREGPLLSTTTNSKPAEMPTTTAGMKSAKPRGREAVEHWSP